VVSAIARKTNEERAVDPAGDKPKLLDRVRQRCRLQHSTWLRYCRVRYCGMDIPVRRAANDSTERIRWNNGSPITMTDASEGAEGLERGTRLPGRRRISRRGMFRNAARSAALVLGASALPARPARAGTLRPSRRELAEDIQQVLWQKILPAWYPRSLDTDNGGFWENFAEDWSRRPASSKFLVYQARMTWVPAAVALACPDRREPYLDYARHGLRFLRDRMWDAPHGGFVDRTDLAGRPDREAMPWKQMYSLAFGLYAAAAVWQATPDPGAGQLARDAFRWIDRHAHDAEHGGYYEHLTAAGQPLAREIPDQPLGHGLPVIGRVGHKSMNAHIHVLEALIELRHVWDDPQLHRRLEEVFLIVRDKIVRPGGHLAMFCARDFTPVDERSSFGHELETAYLLMEAAELLDRDDGPLTERVALELVEHSLRWGWDRQHGGFFDEGPPEGPATHRQKIWWVQVEAMNGLLIADQLTAGKDPRYLDVFAETWKFFRDRMVDPVHGGSFEVVAEDGRPLPEKRHKATPWKAAYHVTRALLLATQRL
jgi:cellobiose epimerase